MRRLIPCQPYRWEALITHLLFFSPAMWSGLFTHLTESWNNFKGLDPDYVTWMDLMEKHGYRTQKFGKLDFTSGHHSVR